ncbi:cytokinin hydroxylase-like isoform X3 [Zingiber officinale]|uniref:cytokinin hydroxylase-like isoform X3 n=1 Tax=Zingiber officinale TaxID=94328 RepID=UPI001C4BC785|nr:cytokinin hydroxylase-like isoform X3 [Zingiber officinale]
MGLLLVITTLVFVFFLLTVLTVAWITFFTYYWTPMHIRRFMRRQGVHGPSPKFLVGNLKDSASMVSASIASDMDFISHDIVSRLMPHYVLWSKIYGKKFIYWYGSEPRLCLTDTDMIKELLSSKYVQLTGKSWLQRQGSKNLIGDGLLMANGSNWFHQRHVVAPAFMADKLKSHVGYMVECTRQMIKSLVEDVGSGQSEVEIGAYMTRLTGDIISRTGFDSSYEKGKKIFQLLERLQSLTAQSSRYLWIPGSRKEAAEFGRSSASGRGLLEMLLDEVQKKRDDGLSYSLKLVMDECKTFFFAGHETSALLLTWTIMLLATNPSWQEKARSEVAEVCGRRPPSAEDLPKLTSVNRSYEKNLHLIINESLRLYPPATLLPRMAFQDMKLGDLMIPKGLSIWIPVLAIHHDEDIWGKDANEFQPERFAGRSFSLTRHFLPFAAGPRNCVGQAYAMMEAKIVLAMFLSAFSFTISNNYRHAPINVLTLRPKHGVLVHLTPLDY